MNRHDTLCPVSVKIIVGFTGWCRGGRSAASFSGQSPSDLLVGLGLAGVHSDANFAAIGAKLRAPLDEIIDQIIIEWDQCIRTPVFGLKQIPVQFDSRPHTPIQRPIPNRLGNVLRLDVVVPFEIGDRPRHSQDLVVGAGRQAQVFHGRFQ